ncbi:DUF3047 domain-containing protein [Roseococcus sp. YIM B11640]|uniref:DUF3047 domain-containing protein n=1 Tax=Roseococcus sp. YIM B11640 TaxID=3133973 RepID=UPI003C7A6BDA
MLAVVTSAALAPAAARASLHPTLSAEGWTHGEYDGLRPASFHPHPQGIAVEAQGTGSFVWKRMRGEAGCLGWRWRVDAGPPATLLTRRGGDDRALAITAGFAGWPPRVTAWQRAQHAIAQVAAGRHVLPRSVLIYVWGGTGQEPDFFPSPWIPGIGCVRVLRPAGSPQGRWFEERVDLAADWRRAFGGEPPPLQEIAIGTDGDDTGTRISAMVEAIRHTGCG